MTFEQSKCGATPDETTPCDDCGQPHGASSGSYWLAPDALWAAVVGRNDVALCIPCFTRRAREAGISVFWQPVAEGVLDALLALPDPVRDEEEVSTFPATFGGLLAFLDERYPAGVFTGESGDVGARLVVLARELAELEPVRDAARETEDLLRRFSEWDMLYVSPEGKAITADAPYWQGEIARARGWLRAALNEEGEAGR